MFIELFENFLATCFDVNVSVLHTFFSKREHIHEIEELQRSKIDNISNDLAEFLS